MLRAVAEQAQTRGTVTAHLLAACEAYAELCDQVASDLPSAPATPESSLPPSGRASSAPEARDEEEE